MPTFAASVSRPGRLVLSGSGYGTLQFIKPRKSLVRQMAAAVDVPLDLSEAEAVLDAL